MGIGVVGRDLQDGAIEAFGFGKTPGAVVGDGVL